MRKKLRVGEFQEFGFAIDFRFDSQKYTLDQALDHWIEFVESQGWGFGGGGGEGSDILSGYLVIWLSGYLVIWLASSGVPSVRPTGNMLASGSIISPALPASSASN
ncbi:50S ribosome-binding protein YggL [Aeromonas caviae]|uniref:50S ribosome-binding protein YggL n=1 Tax=Aeromonas caviae TaxID=648 RepID=UPI00224D0F40|nr:50S ribosome-binding protein YggL [Aeromonas caviae]MCX4036816.1 50S ribosome-binding protein YggL [Aeromonas caviae]